MGNNTTISINLTKLIVSGLILSLGACNQYTTRRDNISPAFGEAPATVSALQTIDPWPVYVENTRIEVDGTKMSNVIDRYLEPQAPESEGNEPIEALIIGPKP